MADIFNFTDLWTVGGTTYDAIKVDVTDTASAAASLLLNLSVGGSVKFSVRKDGHVVAATEAIGGATIGTNALAVTGTANISGKLTLGAGLVSVPSIIFGDATTGFYRFGANQIGVATNGAVGLGFDNSIGTRLSFGYAVGWTNDSNPFATIDANISRNAAGVIQFGTTAANASGAWLAAKGTLTGGTLADQAKVLAITATQPASPTGEQNAVDWQITSAGSAAQVNSAFNLNYVAGFTGNQRTYALQIANNAAGVNQSFIPASGINSAAGNNGMFATAVATTIGYNAGVVGSASGGNINAGTMGFSQIAKNSATNIGVAGSAINTGTTPVQIGGFFSLNQTSVPSVSAALIADNGAQTDAIFLARDNGSTVFTIADGGAVTSTGINSITNATDSTTTTSGALQVAGGMAVRKRVFIDGITASAGLQQAVLCQSSGGEMIADSVACLASSERFKKLLGIVESGAIDKIIRLPIQRWKYNEEGIFKSDDWTRERIGPTAEDVEAIDSRLVGYDTEGKPRNISQEQLLALAIQAIQEQQVQIEDLKARPWAH